jgi:hypothetical protein
VDKADSRHAGNLLKNTASSSNKVLPRRTAFGGRKNLVSTDIGLRITSQFSDFRHRSVNLNNSMIVLFFQGEVKDLVLSDRRQCLYFIIREDSLCRGSGKLNSLREQMEKSGVDTKPSKFCNLDDLLLGS